MSLSLRILPRAERDVQSIYDYIKERSPEGARSWWVAFCKEAQLATLAPWQYPVAPENFMSTLELHQFLFKTRRGRTYRAVFVVIDQEVQILRVRGPGQAPLTEDELSAD